MNTAGCKLLGYSEEELVYHSFDEFVHPEDKDISTKEVMKLGEGETTFKFENRYITKKR
ncbi:PAS domain-containing protein [Algoriphagus boritolerans]|uniref:PAS domain-containing protein n=1 Tax=Algoriphagus boritolerans TaxID=308111 RepID=UPI000A66B730